MNLNLNLNEPKSNSNANQSIAHLISAHRRQDSKVEQENFSIQLISAKHSIMNKTAKLQKSEHVEAKKAKKESQEIQITEVFTSLRCSEMKVLLYLQAVSTDLR